MEVRPSIFTLPLDRVLQLRVMRYKKILKKNLLKKTKIVNFFSKKEKNLDSNEGIDNKTESLMVIFNTSTKAQTFAYSGAEKYQLHPIQQNGVDEIIKHSKANEKGFTVPALSSVLFIKE